ncbi:MAG TPA: hypothetical protein DEA97_04685 [Bacteroidales bacterium]|nr:hypothetical protein [Bacteroidales bacterium]
METLVKKTNGKGSKSDLISKVATNGHSFETKMNGHSTEKAPEIVQEVEIVTEKVETTTAEPVKTVLSIDQKIEKVENLKTLIDKREKLEASRKKLNAFVIGANQFNENIVLTDENGNTFKTSNSEVFTRVVSVINQTLVEKITEIEKQIEF